MKGEIRESVVRELLEKAASRNYGHYLCKLTLKKVRGFVDEPVSFDFPVTALVGPNGGGKTTVLGAAGLPYLDIQPKKFFTKSGKYDESMQDWTIEYELVDRGLNPREPIRRSASFKNRRWNRDAIETRRCLHFGVARTVPANERSELAKCAVSTFEVEAQHERDIEEAVCRAVEKILGKSIRGFRKLVLDSESDVALLAGRTKNGLSYSEFHFGAGEASVIRMVSQIEAAEENALILIEEIENGLHPVAVRRMVEYLIDAAHRKRLQAIFTTHSNDALQPLPNKAIWVASQDRIFQGKLDIQSLRAITGAIEKQLAIFVEDEFAKIWMEQILRAGDVDLDTVEIHPMQGDGIAVAINEHHNKDPSTRFPSVCFIDGDSKQKAENEKRVYRLPGESPEGFVFNSVLDKWPECGGKLAQMLYQTFENEQKVKAVCESIASTNRDPHLLFAQIGARLGLVPEATVQGAFAHIWAEHHPQEVGSLLAAVKELLANAYGRSKDGKGPP